MAWNLRHLSLVALVTMLTMQAMRVLFPLLYHYREHSPLLNTVLFAVAVFAAPVLAAPIARISGEKAALPVTVGLLVAGRIAVQFVHPIPLWLAVVTTGVALIVLTQLITGLRARAPRGTRELVLGVFVGFAIDTAIRASFLTWDFAWQGGPVPTALLGFVLVGTALAAFPVDSLSLRPVGEGTFREALPIALIGPFLALQVLFLQSIAYAASSGQVSLETATVVILLGDALGLMMAALLHGRPFPRVAGAGAVIVLMVAAYALHSITGGTAVATLLVAQVLAAGLLVVTLDVPPPATNQSSWRTGVSVALGGLVLILLVLAYQTHYQTPLPVSNAFVPALAAFLLGLSVLRKRLLAAGDRFAGWAVLPMVPLVLLVVPLVMFLARPDRSIVVGNGRSARVLSYNVHSGVTTAGQIDPEAMARTIEAQRPDVVLLQEVGRGWPISGGLDLAEWMSRRLGMPFVYQPAADEQFGNAVLSRLPVQRSHGVIMSIPDSQRRSFLVVRLDAGAGRSLTVIDAHLQNTKGTSILATEFRRLLRDWGGAPGTVIAGDLNAQPDQSPLRLLTEASLWSLQDDADLGGRSTASHPNFPGDRVDWMFATPDLRATAFAIPWSDASDHLPLAATIWVT